MSVHIEYLDASHTTVEITHDAYVEDEPGVYALRLFCDDGVEISGTIGQLRHLADRINRVLTPDVTSSASRQHWIDTGEFLLMGETWCNHDEPAVVDGVCECGKEIES